MTDAGLAILKALTNLEELNLLFTHVTDDGVKQLHISGTLKALTYDIPKRRTTYLPLSKNSGNWKYWLSVAPVSRTVDWRTSRLLGLEVLSLDDTKVSDAGIEHIRKCNAFDNWI